MKLIDSTKTLNDVFELMDQLDDPDYLAANDIQPDQIDEFKADAEKMMIAAKADLTSLAEYMLRKREESQILAMGAALEVERLTKTKTFYENQVKKRDKVLLWILTTMKQDEIQTKLGRIIAKKGNKMIVGDNGLEKLPEEYLKYSIKEIPADQLKKIQKLGVEIQKTYTSLTDVKKWYDSLSDKEKEAMKLSGIYIDDSAKITLK